MKPHLLILLTAGFCLSPLFGQTETEAPAPEMMAWQKEFSNLPEESRREFSGHLAKSRELFGQKRIFECIEELEEARAIFADSPDVENLMGACQIEFRSFESAMKHFKRADELQPDTPSIKFNIAEVYFVSKQWEQAEAAFSELVEQSKADDAESRNLMLDRLVEFKLMLTKIKLGKMEEAEEMAVLYDHLDDSPYVYYAEAALAYENGDEVTAEAAMARAGRIFQNPAAISPWQDTMMEYGYMKSFFGGDLPEEE
ncbi:tetratricopeptide repeat protein [Haloferula sp.]|uniref:tetratricopeptide repeat protein n=1 Tax=Haloferula sp. TaxID=2497595 RepID=UPI003C7953AF